MVPSIFLYSIFSILYSKFISMSGHSHWATHKHHKGIMDAKRGAIFTKFGRLISIAAREGGDPDMNYKLRLAIDNARGVNMPKENIDRAIKIGTGENKEGSAIEEILYEGYGPGHIAMLIQTATDNRNRTVSDVRTLITKAGGKMGEIGSVAFLFKSAGEIIIDHIGKDIETAELDAIDAGADDVETIEENVLAIYFPFENMKYLKDALETKGYAIKSAGITYRPLQAAHPDTETRAQYEALLEKLDDHPDVQTVWDNLQ